MTRGITDTAIRAFLGVHRRQSSRSEAISASVPAGVVERRPEPVDTRSGTDAPALSMTCSALDSLGPDFAPGESTPPPQPQMPPPQLEPSPVEVSVPWASPRLPFDSPSDLPFEGLPLEPPSPPPGWRSPSTAALTDGVAGEIEPPASAPLPAVEPARGEAEPLAPTAPAPTARSVRPASSAIPEASLTITQMRVPGAAQSRAAARPAAVSDPSRPVPLRVGSPIVTDDKVEAPTLSGSLSIERARIERPTARAPVLGFAQDISLATATVPRLDNAAHGVVAPLAAPRPLVVASTAEFLPAVAPITVPPAALTSTAPPTNTTPAAAATNAPGVLPSTAAPPVIAEAPASAAMAPSIVELLAFGKAMEALQARHGRDVVEVVLSAQQEQLATLAQFYGEQLDRSVRRLSEELTSDSVMEIGELFHRSAGEITGALARTERLSAKVIDKQNLILEALGTLGDRVVAELQGIGGGIARSLASLAPPHVAPVKEPACRFQVISGRTDVFDAIREDLDHDDES